MLTLTINPITLYKLEFIYAQTWPSEYSGFGKVVRNSLKEGFYLYDFELLNVMSPSQTIIYPAQSNHLEGQYKVWCHSHGMGNAIPGNHNWSAVDVAAIKETPLGTIPEIAEWSISLVRTPHGYAARLDTYKDSKTYHLQVLPDLTELASKIDECRTPIFGTFPDTWETDNIFLEKFHEPDLLAENFFINLDDYGKP